MSTISAGLVNVGSLTVNGIGAGAITTTNLNFDNLDVANDLNVGGDLSIKGSQYTYDTSFCYITMGVNYMYVKPNSSVLTGTSLQVKLELNRVGNQVTINFPSFSFYIPQYSSAGSIVSKSAGYLVTTSDGIPVDYRPSSLVYQSTNAPNGTVMEDRRAVTNTFLGSISGSTLTVTQILLGNPLTVGQIISTTAADTSGNSLSAAAGVFISGLGTGKGGKGTYYLNNSTQNINSYTPFTIQKDDFAGSQINMPSYLVQITPQGKLLISGSCSITQQANIGYVQGIPVGINTILPFSMSYMVKDDTDLSDTGINLNSTSVNVINTANWPDCSGFHIVDCSGYSNFQKVKTYNFGQYATRDNEEMDSLNGNRYYSWSDNSVQSNRIAYPLNDASGPFTAPVVDVMFRKIDASGNIRNIQQLTDFTQYLDTSSNYYIYNNSLVPTYVSHWVPNPYNVVPFGTSVAVNRIRPNNVVVTWHPMIFGDYYTLYDYSQAAVSFDGGDTWPTQYNKPLNTGLMGVNGNIDDRGTQCDMYGNFWWCRSSAVADTLDSVGDGGTMFSVSSDGITWYVAYNAPAIPTPRHQFLDSPTYSFGYDGTNSTVSTTVSGTQTLNCVDGSGNLTIGNTLNVVSATAFPTTGSFTVTDSSSVLRKIWYTGKTATSFTGCIATDTFTSFTLNSTSTVQCLGQYGIWVEASLSNLPYIGYSNNSLMQTVWFLPITGPLATGNTFTGYFGSGTGTDLSGCSNILTVTSGGPLSVGQQICGQNLTMNDSSWNRLPWYNVVDPSTTITSIIDGSHYRVSVSQNVASQTCYAVVSPLGPTATISGVTDKTVTTTITVAPSVANELNYANVGTVTVNNTTGAPAIGTFVVPNDSSGYVTLSYYGTTPTSFLNCSAWFNGVGGGFVCSSGKSVRLQNSPSYLTSLGSAAYVSSCATANDGRMFYRGIAGCLFYKSKPNATYPDPVQSNWIGPINTQVPVPGLGGSATSCLEYDDARQTLYLYEYSGVKSWTDVNSSSIIGGNKIATIYFRFSRDNGLTYSDPIIICDQFNTQNTDTANTASTMNLDCTTGNLNFAFYNQMSPYVNTNYNVQYHALTIPSSQINTLLSGTPIVNTTYSVPPAVTPQIGGQLGVYGMMIIPQT